MQNKLKLSRRKKILRFGVIGTGGMGQTYCRITKTSLPHAKLTAVCDVDPQTARNTGERYGVPFFTDYKKLIKSGLCDAVAVATPHPFHPQPAVDCMNAGLHVLTEKPLTERVSTADKMIRAARANKVVFAITFQMRLETIWRQAMQIVKIGMLGEIYRTAMLDMQYRSQRYYDSGTWRATWKGEGGGVLINQSPHLIDMFVQLAGLPSEVLGKTETRKHHIDVEDLA
jgi:predicted dehydrogenase